MKKILSFLAVAIIAAASQAATITWSSGTMYTAKDDTGAWSTDRAKGSVTAVYLIVDQSTYNSYAGKAEDIYKDWSTLEGKATRKSDAITSGNNGQAKWEDDKGGAGYVKADGTIYALALYTYTHATYGDFYIAGAGSAYVNDLGEVEGAYGGLASSVGSWSAVPSSTPDPIPEPTTVALLAIGLAAVGLKRKVA